MSKKHLTLLAGPDALSVIRDEGLDPERVQVIAGAAGGPKWLVLYHLDRVLFSSFFRSRESPLHLIGASSGAWRFAAVCQNDPLAALDRFRDAYAHQTYASVPTPEEVTEEGQRIISAYIGEKGVDEILSNPWLRIVLLAARSKYFAAFENRYLRGAGLAGAALHNLVNRRLLGLSFERTLFHDSRNSPPVLSMDGIPTRRVPLSADNFKKALLASGSIPLVMSGVRAIPGAPPGCYLDGGIVDYHLNLPYDLEKNAIVLMPHYIDRIIPGWLDKKLIWRKPQPSYLRNVLLIAPSEDFTKTLPGGKIPDRTDFKTYFGKDKERIKVWEAATDACRCLGEEFMELVESGRIRGIVNPIVG